MIQPLLPATTTCNHYLQPLPATSHRQCDIQSHTSSIQLENLINKLIILFHATVDSSPVAIDYRITLTLFRDRDPRDTDSLCVNKSGSMIKPLLKFIKQRQNLQLLNNGIPPICFFNLSLWTLHVLPSSFARKPHSSP